MHPVQKAVAQVNPIDNGRTWQNQTPTNKRSAIGQLTHNGATNQVGNVAKGVVQPFVGFGKSVINTPAMLAADISNNPIAQAHIQQRTFGTTNQGKIARKIIGNTVGTGLTLVAPELKGASLLAKTAAGSGLGAGINAASALANGASNKDIAKAAAVGGVLGGALPVAGKVLPKVAKVAGNSAKDVATLKPYRNISDNQLAAVNRVTQSRNGFGDAMANVQPNDNAIYRQVQAKLGAKGANDHAPVEKLIGARQTYETKIANQKQTLSNANDKINNFADKHNLGIGASTQAVDSNGNKVSAFSGKPLTNGARKPIPQQLSGEVPTTPRVAQASGESLPKNTPKVVPNSLTKGAKQGKQNVSPEVQALVSGDHVERNTQQLADSASTHVDSLPVNTAIEQAHSMIAQPLGHVNDAQTAVIAKTIEKADTAAFQARQAGNVVEADRLTREAAALHDGLSEHATARGQSNQALVMLYNQSPQGMLYRGLKDLGKTGVKDTPELRAKLQPFNDAIKEAKANEAKATTPEAKAAAQAQTVDAIAKFHQAVSKTMPQHTSDKLLGIWKAGLLSGVKTQQGNAISNATFAGLKKISDIPATAADKAMSLVTGKRTKTLTGKGSVQGTIEGSKNAKFTMKTGLDRRSAGDKYEQHAEIDFKNPVLNKTVGAATRTIFRGMNAADQPFWYASFKNSMYDQAKAAGINKGLKGSELTQFMNDTVKDPTPSMANTALNEANKSTLNYDTVGSKAIQQAHKGIDNVPGITPAGAKIAHGALNVLAPFVRVPTAFLSRTIDFTPLGTGKEIFHQIAGKQFDQRALSQAIGEGLTGTGAIALGISLTQHKMLSGDYPKNDPKEAQRWKAEKITPNSVKLGGKWINLNYLGPLGLLFNAGNKIENAKGQGSAEQAGQALAGFGSGLMGQSFLQGFTGFSDAIQDPTRNAKSFVNSQASSVVPSIVNDAANVTDSFQRQSNSATDAIKGRIPGARESLAPKQDVYGNPLKQPAGSLNTLNGLKPSNSATNSNPAIAEVSRLHDVNPNDAALQVTPTPVGKSITVEKKNIPLNDKQRYDLQKQVGQATQSKWNDLIKTDSYKAMNDTQKAAALNNIRTYATEDATRAYVTKNNLAAYTKPESSKAIALNQGSSDIGTLAASKATGGSSTTPKSDLYKSPDAEYKALQASYNTKAKTNAFGSDAARITATNALNKAKVGSSYDKSIRDAYNLSNKELYDYVSTNPDGNKIVKQVLDYSQALKDAGITSTAKFKNKYGQATLGSTSSAKTSTGRKSTTSLRKLGIKAPSLKTIKATHLKTPKTTAFTVKTPKSPSFKTKRTSIPKLAYKAPKVTKTVMS